jgi:hypothetical protein
MDTLDTQQSVAVYARDTRMIRLTAQTLYTCVYVYVYVWCAHTHTNTYTHILDLTKMLDLMEGSFMQGGCVPRRKSHCAIHRGTHPF